MIIHCIVTLTE